MPGRRPIRLHATHVGQEGMATIQDSMAHATYTSNPSSPFQFVIHRPRRREESRSRTFTAPIVELLTLSPSLIICWRGGRLLKSMGNTGNEFPLPGWRCWNGLEVGCGWKRWQVARRETGLDFLAPLHLNLGTQSEVKIDQKVSNLPTKKNACANIVAGKCPRVLLQCRLVPALAWICPKLPRSQQRKKRL